MTNAIITAMRRFLFAKFAAMLNRKFQGKVDAARTIPPPTIAEMNGLLSGDACTVYVHFPFCSSACKYCPFGKTLDTAQVESYERHLLREIGLWALMPSLGRKRISSIYFGGGTPSLMPLGMLKNILDATRALFSPGTSAETTLECNPDSLKIDNLKAYLDMGINRFSIGVQSFHDPVLREMGRSYDGTFVSAMMQRLSKVAGLRFNVDLMYGFQSQTMEMFQGDIGRAVDSGCVHIALFALTRPRSARRDNNTEKMEEKRLHDMYAAACKTLESRGFSQYSTEDFARSPDDRNRYQMDWWRIPTKDVVSLGTWGFGGLDGYFYTKERSMAAYAARIDDGTLPLSLFRFDKQEEMSRRLLLGLHYIAVEREAFERKYGCDAVAAGGPLVWLLRSFGLVRVNADRIQLTDEGRFAYTRLWAQMMGAGLGAGGAA
jgi:oxygen-independent coproporphyrinogen III oxidase